MANFKMAILGTLGVAAARRWRRPSFPSPVAAPCFTPMPIARIRGPGNPYTDPNYQRGQNAAAWQGDQTVGVAPRRRARKHTAATNMY